MSEGSHNTLSSLVHSIVAIVAEYNNYYGYDYNELGISDDIYIFSKLF